MNCPSCQRILYDRRLPCCGYCGARIPVEMQFTTEQIAAINRDMEELKQKQRQRELAAEKELQEASDGSFISVNAGLP